MMGCFSKREIEAAAKTEAACRARLAEIEKAHQAATSTREHQSLSREAHNVYRDLQAATFVLTETGGAS
ncbi:hypothetical protein [Streptomyces sp. NPDC049744]|uniref:hypothetical protein n=1 Tax=Streptomyces sp. NPDC049744 TaxID=3154359 RepID=UPI003443F8B5